MVEPGAVAAPAFRTVAVTLTARPITAVAGAVTDATCKSASPVTLRAAAFVMDPRVPEMVTDVAAAMTFVAIANVALVPPPATVTVAATVAAVVLLLARPTTTPSGGAGALRVTVPVEKEPARTMAGA